MDLAPLVPWLSFAALLIAIGTSLSNIFSAGSKKTAEDLSTVKEELAKSDRRIQRLEDEIKHLPDRNSTHRLEIFMEKMNGRLDAMDERLKPIQVMGERLNEALLEQARK